jgi:acyl carrier protein
MHADLARWFAIFGERVQIVNLYGPSETTMTKLFHRVRPADLGRRSIPVGRPMDGAAVLVVDDQLRACAPGTCGEVLLRTPYRSLGYLGRPDLTAEAFVPNPFAAGGADVVYRTGDLGRLLPDGALELLGRRDHQLKIRGQRIEPREIESALLDHPRVLQAAVVGRPDGEGFMTLCAFVAAGEEIDVNELREWVARRLPASHVPDRFTTLPELPRTRNGKLDRRALTRIDLRQQPAAPRQAPRTDTERCLLEIWREVTGAHEIGTTDNFFAVGGHSLMATRLLLRVRAAFGSDVPLKDFLDRPTIAALAEEIEERILFHADPASIEAILREIDAARQLDGGPPISR